MEERSAEHVAGLIYEWLTMFEGWVFLNYDEQEKLAEEIQDRAGDAVRHIMDRVGAGGGW